MRQTEATQAAEKLARPFTVREYQQMNAYIYTMANRRYTDNALFLRLIEEVCKVMEIARKDKREEFAEQLARTFSWWLALGNRLNVNLQEALWHKYPNVCPWCLRPQNCNCAVEHPRIQEEERETILRRLRLDHSNVPQLLSDHQNLHRRLYASQNARIFPIQSASHIAEEIGEVSKEFRHGNRQEMEDEIADVASWIFAVANRLNIDIAEAVWVLYPYECEKCHKAVCDCVCSDPPQKRESSVI